MTEVFLVSEIAVRQLLAVSDNVAGQFTAVAIREAQEVDYRRVIGAALLEQLKGLVATSSIGLPEYVEYKALLDASQLYLAYAAAVRLIPRVQYKVANVGMFKASDDHATPASYDDMAAISDSYRTVRDAFCRDLQAYLLRHAAEFPELAECHCREIRAQLNHTATCGIYLGA